MSALTTVIRLVALAVLAALVSACGGSTSVQDRFGTADQIYNDGTRALETGAWANAVGYFELLEVRYPFSKYTKQAQLDLIYAYYRDNQPESAIDAADKFIRENPRHPNVDYAYYLRGLVFFEREPNPLERLFRVDLTKRPPTDANRALANFEVLLRRFPDSQYAPDTRQRIVFLRNRLAEYEKHVADYYMVRGAWVAAINRTKNIIEEYHDTTVVADALRIQARAYRKLGMDDLAADAERVLAANYPDAG